jgi:hypothetical protein
MKFALLYLFLPVMMMAAVSGTVTNGTTGQPQPGVIIQMVQPSQAGMQTLGTVKSGADGSFTFDKTVEGPTLLQAIYHGVMYTHMIPPGAPSSGIGITVHDATTDPKVVKAAEHFFILQPSSEGISVEEVLFLKNTSNKTYNDPKGTFRFYLPDNVVGTAKVSLTSPDGKMPVQREATKTDKPNVYTVDYALKPGDTQVAISYAVQAGADRSFKSRILDEAPTARLVVPTGVTAEGTGLSPMGQDPQNKANIYDIKGKELAVVLKGDTPVAAADTGGSEDDTGAPEVESSKPRIYERLPLVLSLSFAMLAIGFVLMYRGSPRKGSASR